MLYPLSYRSIAFLAVWEGDGQDSNLRRPFGLYVPGNLRQSAQEGEVALKEMPVAGQTYVFNRSTTVPTGRLKFLKKEVSSDLAGRDSNPQPGH